MKNFKNTSILMLLTLIFANFMPYSNAEDYADVYIGTYLISSEQPAIIANDRTLVPLRAICDQLDCSVEWENTSKTAIIRNQYVNISLQINNYTSAKIYRYAPDTTEYIKLDVPPIIYNDRTYIPLRFVSESLNADVSWDDSSKRVIITPKYDGIVYDFDDGYAIIYKISPSNDDYTYPRLYGILNTHGDIIIEPQYDSIDTISNGLFAVCKNEKWGFVDTTGKEVIPTLFDDVGNFMDSGLVVAQKDWKYGIINKSNETILPFKYDYISSFFTDDLAEIRQNDKCGFVDINGKITIPLIYDTVNTFSDDGINTVQKNGQWYIINRNGDTLASIPYTEATDFSNGLAAVKVDDKWGFMDKNGDLKIPATYDYAFTFSDGYATVCQNDTWGVINQQGDFFTTSYESSYDYVCAFNSNGLAAATKNSKWGFINVEGKEVIPFKYDQIDSERIVGTRAWDAPGGNVFLGAFHDGLTRVEVDMKWGFLDEKGNEAIPLIYDYVWNFKDGLAKVEKDGLVYYIDKNGNRV